MKLQSIKNVNGLKGKRILVRVDFNVPIQAGKVVDDFRIRKVLPTIEFLKKKGAKIILLSHIGREGESLKPVADYIKKDLDIIFVPKVVGSEVVDVISKMNNGDVILLENLRSHNEEIENNELFAKELANLGDVYINEAFAASHREHTSIVSVPKYLPSYIGLQFEAEINNLEKVLINPDHPFLFILGGVKFETKIPLIKKFFGITDNIFIGGALANDFFKAQGYEVGSSVVSENKFKLDEFLASEKLTLPIDILVTKDMEKIPHKSAFSLPAEASAQAGPRKSAIIKKPNEVNSDEMIVDTGPESLKALRKYIHRSEFILWNGPLGYYDHGFDQATKKLIKILAESDTETIVGGGDTVALISQLGLEEKFSFVSTGGGAMLEFLEKGTLPGVEALESEQKI